MDNGRVAAAAGIEEGDLLVAARAGEGKQAVTLAVVHRRRVDIVALGRAHPALLAEHHGHRFARRQIGFRQCLGGAARYQRRATGIAEFLRVGQQLVLDQLLQLRLAAEQRNQLVAFLGERVLLAADLHLFQPRQLAQAGFQDVVGLHLGQVESRHQHRPRLVLAADDADHLIQVEECHQQAFQQVQALLDLFQTMRQAAGHRVDAERQPLGQERLQALDLRAAVQTDHVHVDPEAFLQIGGRKQVTHQLLDVDPVAARKHHDPGRVGVVGLVADVLQPRQLFGPHLVGDLLDHLARRDLVRQARDDDRVGLALVHRAGTHAADAGLVHLQQVGARGDDLGAGGVIGAPHVLAQVRGGSVRIIQQPDARADHFAQVVRREIGGHADGNAGGAVEQQVRQACRHPRRLLQGAVEVRVPVHRAVRQLAQQDLGERGELGLGVAHRRERLGVVAGTEVALAFHQRIAVGERLRHQHHRLIAGAVTVWMVFADHVADGARGLLRLGAGVQPQLGHREDDPSLHRFQPVTQERQRTVEHHVHRIIEVRALGIFTQRELFVTVEGGPDGIGHAVSWTRSGLGGAG